jgi:hypothetical protein
VQRATGVEAAFFVALAEQGMGCYRVLFEPAPRAIAAARDLGAKALAERIDRALMDSNIEYAAKRASGRLGPLVVDLVQPGLGESCRMRSVASGQREGQWKPQVLQYAADFGVDWSEVAS